MTLIIVFTNIIVIVKNLVTFFFKSKYSFLDEFFDDLDKFNKLNLEKESTAEKKINEYKKASELYNDFLGIYFEEYYVLSDDKRKKIRAQI